MRDGGCAPCPEPEAKGRRRDTLRAARRSSGSRVRIAGYRKERTE